MESIPETPDLGRTAEAVCVFTCLCICAIMVFPPHSQPNLFLGRYLIFPFLIWCALRFGTGGASLAGPVLTFIAILNTSGRPSNAFLYSATLVERVWSLEAFLSVAVFSALVLAAAFEERRTAEQTIARLGRRNILILDAVDEGVIGLDVQGRIIFSNPSAARTTGFSMEEMHGKDLHALLHHTRPDGSPYPSEECPMHRTIREGVRNRVLDETLWRKDGTSFPVSYSATPTVEAGKVCGAVVTFRNITRRRLAEEALLESQFRYRLIFDNASDAIFIHNFAGRILEVNQVACDRLGYTRDALLQLNLRDIEAPEFAGLLPDRNGLIQRNGSLVFETVHVRRDGVAIPIEANTRPIQYGGGNAFICISRDIAERKRAEEALRKSEAKFRELSQEAPIGISLMKSDLTFEYLNPAFTELFGYTLEDLPDKNSWFAKAYRPSGIEDQMRALWESRLRQHLVDGKTVEDVLQVKCRDGSEKIVNSRFVVMDDGRHLQTYQDVTAHVKLEARLRQAQKMEAIGTLAGGIAHDFNNILSPIIGFTELALDELPAENRLRHDLEQILHSSNRAKQLVRQILTFGKSVEHDREPVQISLLIKEASNLLRASLPSTIDLRLNISPDAASSTVMADSSEIHQILMNLCTNAGHSMREKGGLLEIALNNVHLDADFCERHEGVEPGAHVKLTVSDTGHGMTDDVKGRVFEPYFTTKGPTDGTGLGLSVVYGIVKKSKGIIDFYSERGMGTVFHVFLPRANNAGAEASPAEEEIRGGEGRILLIDDEEVLVRVEERMLQRLGYQVTAKTDSLEALAAFQRQPDAYDLVITDHTMPRMTGADLAREMLLIRPDLPVILCTGFSETMDEVQARDIGIGAFVMKPVVMRELAEVIHRLLVKGGDKAH